MAGRVSSTLPAMSPPHAAAGALSERVAAVGTEVVPLAEAAGRVLAERVVADRDSPAADVSAMDGYAVRAAEWNGAALAGGWPVSFEVETGVSPPALPEGSVARVFTGGVVPAGAEAVVKREDVVETAGFAAPRPGVPPTKQGQHIRRRGENAAAGDPLLEPGGVLTAPAVTTAASAGRFALAVYRRVRVSVLVTGNELDQAAAVGASGGTGEARVRDSNGPALAALLSAPAWTELVEVAHVGDSAAATRDTIARLAAGCDVLVTTGGVSMGDHDRVPGALVELGAEVVYHHLSMRPGKPNLGASLPGGTAVVCLPGNPVSVLVGGVVLAGPVLRRAAGWSTAVRRPAVAVTGSAKVIPLTRFLLATLDGEGRAVLLDQRGSGDVAAVGRSMGFVELPAGVDHEAAAHSGTRWPWWAWSVSP